MGANFLKEGIIWRTMENFYNKKKAKQNDQSHSSTPLKEGEDFIYNEKGLMVFTKEYHLKRGYCCDSKCQNCPY